MTIFNNTLLTFWYVHEAGHGRQKNENQSFKTKPLYHTANIDIPEHIQNFHSLVCVITRLLNNNSHVMFTASR